MDDNYLERLYKEHVEVSYKLLAAVEHQTDVLSRCIVDEMHLQTVERMKEHEAIKTKVNIGIVQMLAIFVSTIMNWFR
jgi:hypothetical protein